MYAKGPSAKELEAFGLLAEDVGEATIEVWPENWLPVKVFSMLSTQWRVGPGGPTGLDYGVIPGVMQIMGVRNKDRLHVMEAIRQMEVAALGAMTE